jgi:sterol desaturase/sphingolipid hydroxylase (fatty acid hydroxylase superfamily)
MVNTMYIVASAAGTFIVGTLAEYFVHRLMHWGVLYPEGHRYHHESGDPRTFLRDVIDYGMGAAPFAWFGFVVSVPIGIGTVIGAISYVLLASYSHQLQHARADLVFWMGRPVHGVHHALDQRDSNFGILVDWWDRLFGTYRPVEWQRSPSRPTIKDYVAIPWW